MLSAALLASWSLADCSFFVVYPPVLILFTLVLLPHSLMAGATISKLIYYNKKCGQFSLIEHHADGLLPLG